MRSRTQPAMAAATTTMTTATNSLGSQAMTPAMRSLTGLGPKMPNASCSTNSRNANITRRAVRSLAV